MRSDEALAYAIQQGDTDAVQGLVERHHSPLLGYLYRMMNGNRPLAEDLVQETFLRFLRTIHHYRYPRPFKPWLYAIATNLARDHYKRAEVRHTVPVSGEALQRAYPQGAAPPDEALLMQDESAQIVAALQALPDHQREALMLRYYQELSLQEIADTLDIPVGTVKSRLSLGLRRLQAFFAQGGHGG